MLPTCASVPIWTSACAASSPMPPPCADWRGTGTRRAGPWQAWKRSVPCSIQSVPRPLSLLRAQLRARRFKRSSELRDMPHGQRVSFAGLVTMRQRPQTASGVTFITLEDEDGLVNAVVWQHVAERQRREFLESRLMAIEGRVERADGVQHLIATRLEDLTPLLSGLMTSSRDFH